MTKTKFLIIFFTLIICSFFSFGYENLTIPISSTNAEYLQGAITSVTGFNNTFYASNFKSDVKSESGMLSMPYYTLSSSIIWQHKQTASANRYSYLIFDLSSVYLLDTNSIINYTIKNSLANNEPLILYFLDDDKNLLWKFASDCGLGGLESSPCVKYNQMTFGTTTQKESLAFNSTLNYTIDVRYIAFGYVRASSSTANITISDITIYNTYDYSNNSLPTINIENISNICYNSTTYLGQDVYFDLAVEDTENNTIYYAIDTKTLYRTNTQYKYYFAKSENNYCRFDEDFFTSKFIDNNNTYAINGIFSLFIDYQMLGRADVRIFTTECSGVLELLPKMTTFYLSSPLLPDSNYSQRIEFIMPKESYFQLDFYNNVNTNFKKIGFNYTGANLTIYEDGVSKFSHSYNSEVIAFELFEFYNSTAQYHVNSLAWSITDYDSAVFNYSEYNKVGFSVNPNNQYNIIIGLINLVATDKSESLSWTTDKPNNITMKYKNSNYIKIYATDSVHLNKEYNTDIENIFIQDCIYDTAIPSDYKFALNSVRTGIKNICTSIDTGLNLKFGSCAIIEAVVIAISIIIGLVIGAMIVNIFAVLLTESLSVLILSLFIPMSDTTISIHLILFALGIAGLMISLFSNSNIGVGGNNSGGNGGDIQ